MNYPTNKLLRYVSTLHEHPLKEQELKEILADPDLPNRAESKYTELKYRMSLDQGAKLWYLEHIGPNRSIFKFSVDELRHGNWIREWNPSYRYTIENNAYTAFLLSKFFHPGWHEGFWKHNSIQRIYESDSLFSLSWLSYLHTKGLKKAEDILPVLQHHGLRSGDFFECTTTHWLLPNWLKTTFFPPSSSDHHGYNLNLPLLKFIFGTSHLYLPYTMRWGDRIYSFGPSLLGPEESVPVRDSSGTTHRMLPHQFRELRGLATVCATCRSWVHRDCIADAGKCLYCAESNPVIKVYSYSTNPLMHLKIQISQQPKAVFKPFSKPLLLGCELEYNCSESKSAAARAQIMKSLQDFAIFKSDGSLETGGFEIVTAPADKEMHLTKFKSVFPLSPAVKITQGTGMHVHMDREILTKLTLGRLVEFMHFSDNKEFIELIGERPLNSFSTQDRSMTWALALTNDHGGPRYSTLNLNKGPTIEFRIFKSPATYESFAKNLEFVLTLRHFCMSGWSPFTPKEGRHWSKFKEYVKMLNRSKNEERNETPYLYHFLKEKGAL